MEQIYNYIVKTLAIIGIIQAEIGITWIFYEIYTNKEE